MPTSLPRWPDKDPADVADYTLEFTHLFPAGDAITSTTWEIAPPGVFIESQLLADRAVSVKLSGGQPGALYRLTATAISAAARTIERSVTLFVREM